MTIKLSRNKNKNNFYAIAGERITTARIAAGMTPEDAARAVGITIDHIKGIEAGTLKVDTTTLERICRAVGLSRLRLITGLDEADINKVSAKVEEDTEMLIILRGLSKKRQEIWKRRFGANV